MKPMSVDLRKRVVSARLVDGQSMGEIAQRLQIPKASVQTILKHHQDTQKLDPKPHAGGRAAAFSSDALRMLESEVSRRPGATLEQLRDACGVKASVVAVLQHAQEAGLHSKKKSLRASEQRGVDIAAQRADWLNRITTAKPSKLVFLDKTGAKFNMTCAYGRDKRGESAVDYTPFGHWHTTTLEAAVTANGPIAPTVLDGPMDRAAFEVYVEQFMADAAPAESNGHHGQPVRK